MLRKDPNAYFREEHRREGLLLRKNTYYRFVSGKYESAALMSESEFTLLCRRDAPVPVLRVDEVRRVWWLFRGVFYWEDDGLTQPEVNALLVERGMLKERRVGRAMDRAAAGRLGAARSRQAIPDDVKVAVWRRDSGHCVRCGSQEDLEYDHIIPHSKGGSDGVRNIQLMCQSCNRAKGAGIA